MARVARRMDFYDDPGAPAADSLVPSVNVVVTNADGDVLLIRRSDNHNWAVPGGCRRLGMRAARCGGWRGMPLRGTRWTGRCGRI